MARRCRHRIASHLVACVVPVVRDDRPRIPAVARRFGGVFVLSLASVWLGVALAHQMTEAT
jgi:hypothetical protein